MLHHSSGSSYQRKVMRERHEKQEKYTQLHKKSIVMLALSLCICLVFLIAVNAVPNTPASRTSMTTSPPVSSSSPSVSSVGSESDIKVQQQKGRQNNHERLRPLHQPLFCSSPLAQTTVQPDRAVLPQHHSKTRKTASSDDSLYSPALSQSVCETWHWPVDSARERIVMRPAEIPSQNWNRGHRGVDLPAQEDDLLVAPDNGIITFAGSVAGKNVVTLELIEKSYGEPIHVSFEPATTTLKTGDFLA